MIRKYTKKVLAGSCTLLLAVSCSGESPLDEITGKESTEEAATSTEFDPTTTEATETGQTKPSEKAIVKTPTSQLKLSGSLAVLPAKKGASLAFADGTKEYSFALAEDRKLNLRMTNEAFEIIEQAGSILCFLGQTMFWDNAGAESEETAVIYKAQVDENKCDNGSGEKSSGGGGGEGGGQKGRALEDVFVKAWRVPERPLVAEFKVGGGPEEPYYAVRVVVMEPPSQYAPAGIFYMRYNPVFNGEAMGGGFILTERVKVEGGAPPKFVLAVGMDEEQDDRTHTMFGIAELSIAENGDVKGFVNSSMSGTEKMGDDEQSYSSAGVARFNDKFLNVDFLSEYSSPHGEGEEEHKGCYNLNKYKTSIFRYDLLGSDGKPVRLKSGFSIEFEDSDGNTGHGWAGYHGLWTENVQLESGAKVNKVDWSSGGDSPAKEEYEVFVADGKLTKYTKATITLGELTGVDLRLWDTDSEYVVHWNGTKFVKVSKITFGDKGMTEEAAEGDVTIDEWGTSLRAESLNADIRISKDDVLSDTFVVSYHSQAMVSGSGDEPTCNMVCFGNCPVMAPSASDFSSSGGYDGPGSSGLYEKTNVDFGDGNSQESNQAGDVSSPLATYTWDKDTQNLKKGDAAFALPSDLSSSSGDDGGYQMNIWSGALVCEDSMPTDKTIDPYRLENALDFFYRFEAGAQNWNKFQGLKDSSGAFYKFDKPLELSYEHSTANDFDGDSTHDGDIYRIEYNGPGQLHMPWAYDENTGHEMPEINLKAGVKMGDSDEYTVVPLEGEQRLMKADDEASCADLSLTDMSNLDETKAEGEGDQDGDGVEDEPVSISWDSPTSAKVKYIAGELATELKQ